MKKADSSYDSVVKDLFQRDRPSLLLDRLTGGVRVRQTLNIEFSRVIERRTDSAFLLEDNTVLHLEFQTSNDPDMAYRQGIYCLLIGQKYRRQVRQAVVYLGLKKMSMPRELNLGETQVAYTLLDIREFEVGDLLASGRAADLPLAILARGGEAQALNILKRIAALPCNERPVALFQLVKLSALRPLHGKLIMEMNRMLKTQDPLMKLTIVREAVQKAERKGRLQTLRDQLKLKFHTLPNWANEKLDSANSAQLRRWLKNFVKAKTLEEVLGKK